MGRGNWKVCTVDEVEVPHRKVGANRFAGKIERSAGASQDSHILIHRPFEKQHVNAERVTVQQIVSHVARCNETRFDIELTTFVAFVLQQEGAFPIQSTNESGQARPQVCDSNTPIYAARIEFAVAWPKFADTYSTGVKE